MRCDLSLRCDRCRSCALLIDVLLFLVNSLSLSTQELYSTDRCLLLHLMQEQCSTGSACCLLLSQYDDRNQLLRLLLLIRPSRYRDLNRLLRLTSSSRRRDTGSQSTTTSSVVDFFHIMLNDQSIGFLTYCVVLSCIAY